MGCAFDMSENEAVRWNPHLPLSGTMPLSMESAACENATQWNSFAASPERRRRKPPALTPSECSERSRTLNRQFCGFLEFCYLTVTDFARFLGRSGLQPRRTAMWYAMYCSGTVATSGYWSSGTVGMGSHVS